MFITAFGVGQNVKTFFRGLNLIRLYQNFLLQVTILINTSFQIQL